MMDLRTLLASSMWETAQLFAAQNVDGPVIEYYGTWDGLKIPPSTRVKVIVVLEHLPDAEVTPELVMDANPT